MLHDQLFALGFDVARDDLVTDVKGGRIAQARHRHRRRRLDPQQGQVLVDTVQANPGGTPCFIYQRATAAGQTYITNVAVTLTVATVNANRNTGQVEQETKALLNVSPRNVFNVWQLAGLGVTNRVQATPASVVALLP